METGCSIFRFRYTYGYTLFFLGEFYMAESVSNSHHKNATLCQNSRFFVCLFTLFSFIFVAFVGFLWFILVKILIYF